VGLLEVEKERHVAVGVNQSLLTSFSAPFTDSLSFTKCSFKTLPGFSFALKLIPETLSPFLLQIRIHGQQQ
jgi:hypothetical protein